MIEASMTELTNETSVAVGLEQPAHEDATLCALLRAFAIKFGETSISAINQASKVVNVRRRTFCEEVLREGTEGGAAVAILTCDTIDGKVESDGWVEQNQNPRNINAYLSQLFPTRVFISQGTRQVAAVVEKHTTFSGYRGWRKKFLSSLVFLMPWYFPSAQECDIKDLFLAVAESTESDAKQAVISFVNEMARKLDFRTLAIENQLSGYGAKIHEYLVQRQQKERDDCVEQIQSLETSLRIAYHKLQEASVHLNALQNSGGESDDELIDFFKSHKQLSIQSVTRGGIRYEVRDTLEFYDVDDYIAARNNPRSYVGSIEDEQVKRVLDAVVEESKGVFETAACFELSGMRRVSPISGTLNARDCLPQPHIYFYGCSGGNEEYYQTYAEKCDWQSGIEQSIAATKNLNWLDGAVVSSTIDWLISNKHVPCIRVEKLGKLLSVEQFYQMLEKGEL